MTNMSSIPVKAELKYLGVTISKDRNEREICKIEEKINNMEKFLNHWLTRDVSILGRIQQTKAEGISNLIYPCQALYVSPQLIKKVNSVICNFIWRK